MNFPVNVISHKGDPYRFVGKYKCPDTGTWKKIPGGPLPAAYDSKPKALAFARRWYEAEIAERQLAQAAPKVSVVNWAEVCDLFVVEAKARIRGADASKDEAEKRAAFLRRSIILCSRPVAQHDEALGLVWVRSILSEPLGRKGHEDEPRDPLTVRNAAKVLRDIYKFARLQGYFPRERALPTESDEFRAEIAGALKEKAKIQKEARVACPTDAVKAVVNCKDIPEMRRLMRRTAFFTGLAPGELHGLHVGDYRAQYGVKLLDVHEQWTLARKNYPARLTPLKTVHRRRKLPVHPSLQPHLDSWVTEGWQRHVGRAPKNDDFLFVDPSGCPFREESCEDFLDEIRLVKFDTIHKGVTLDIYSLRHSFATIARRAGITSDSRDQLLGHRPKDTKAEHYEDEDIPLLAREVAKIPSLLDDEANTAETPPSGSEALAVSKYAAVVPVMVPCNVHGSGASSVSLMISEEERRFELLGVLQPRRFSKPLP
jgi:integrase